MPTISKHFVSIIIERCIVFS